jgi:diguanylate cyclase (GGDEF)-like protein
VVRIACDLIAAARGGIEDVYRSLERALRTVVALDALTLWELEADRFSCVFTSGGRYQHFLAATLSALARGSPLGEARRCGRECWVEAPLVPLQPSDRCALAIPLQNFPLVAYLALAHKPQKSALRECIEIAAIADAALEVARDRADDRATATYDGLTGLLTPRAFRAELSARLREMPRVRIVPRMALVFVDTDRFKEWNDRFGHASGDGVLRRLAAMLRAHAVGPEDLVARNGGDEFCVVWTDCEKSSAILRAESLRNSIAGAFAGEAIAITASIGVAAYPIDARTAEELLEAADAAMYDAKRGGRNKVCYRT